MVRKNQDDMEGLGGPCRVHDNRVVYKEKMGPVEYWNMSKVNPRKYLLGEENIEDIEEHGCGTMLRRCNGSRRVMVWGRSETRALFSCWMQISFCHFSAFSLGDATTFSLCQEFHEFLSNDTSRWVTFNNLVFIVEFRTGRLGSLVERTPI
ncbi:hypothetical protein VNO78_32748 [Psophocarpus tetragonolobus]|uniref:Uncharacterized protein n=1 Tax=Psophocarpus tetragonolobus TaxID=3891 RepID=A0AAN9P303_PSOTE